VAHLSPAALDAAIRLLDGPAEAGHYDRKTGRGEMGIFCGFSFLVAHLALKLAQRYATTGDSEKSEE
jgi:hypothetical protein